MEALWWSVRPEIRMLPVQTPAEAIKIETIKKFFSVSRLGIQHQEMDFRGLNHPMTPGQKKKKLVGIFVKKKYGE